MTMNCKRCGVVFDQKHDSHTYCSNKCRSAEFRKSPQYRDLMDRTRESRKARKEKYRREAGAVPRDVIHAKAVEKKISEAKQKELKKQFEDFFVGPPKPHSFLSKANYYRWRYQNDDEFREKEKIRSKTKKAACPDFYIRQQLGGIECSKKLIEAKRLQLQIKRFIKEINHEKY